MKTATMDENLRQRNPDVKTAVEASLGSENSWGDGPESRTAATGQCLYPRMARPRGSYSRSRVVG